MDPQERQEELHTRSLQAEARLREEEVSAADMSENSSATPFTPHQLPPPSEVDIGDGTSTCFSSVTPPMGLFDNVSLYPGAAAVGAASDAPAANPTMRRASEEFKADTSNNKMKKKQEIGKEGSTASTKDTATSTDQIDLMEVVRARIDDSSLSNEKKIAAPMSPGGAESKTTVEHRKKKKKEGAEPAGAAAADSFDILDVVRARTAQDQRGNSLSLPGAYAQAPGASPRRITGQPSSPQSMEDALLSKDFHTITNTQENKSDKEKRPDLSLTGAYAEAPGKIMQRLEDAQWWKDNEPGETNGQSKQENESEAPPSTSSLTSTNAQIDQGADDTAGDCPEASDVRPRIGIWERLMLSERSPRNFLPHRSPPLSPHPHLHPTPNPRLPTQDFPEVEVRSSQQSQRQDVLLAQCESGASNFSDLSEAMAIYEDSLHIRDVAAEPVDVEASEQRRARWEKQRNLFIGVSICLICLAVVAFLLGFLLHAKRSDPDGIDSGHTVKPTISLSLPPTPFSVSSFVLELLPEETQWTISRREDSPQARAYEWMLQDPNVTKYQNWRLVQRFALATLYLATNGPNWSRNTNWLSYDKHECEWHISPVYAMKDTLGTLYPGFMDGIDPPSQNCYQDNDYQDNSSTTISSSSMNGKYQNLWLDQNSLEGTLPKELYLLTSLQTMSIMFNKLEGRGSRIPSHIGQLTHLEGLVLHGLENVGSLPKEIGLLTNLRGIMLSQFTGTVPTEFHSLTNLETICYHRNPQLTGPITPMFIHYPNLKFWAVEGSDFTGTVPTEIGLLQSLLFIAMNTNRVTGTLPTQVGLLTNLGMWFQPENSMTGTLPTELGLLSSAKFLGFRNNFFSGTIPSEMGGPSDLASLIFEGNELVGLIPTQLGQLTMLFDLTFESNAFSGPIPSEFGSLTTLASMSLGKNSLTGTIPEELMTVLNPKLYLLDVSGNPLLSGRIPEALCRVNGTCTSMTLNNCDTRQGLIFDCKNSLLCGCNCPCKSAIGNNNATMPTRQDFHGSLR